MKRYYSHYIYIYPDIFLKNHIVELDDESRIVKFFPFEKEIEKTEFYSGVLICVPKNLNQDNILIDTISPKLIDCFNLNISSDDLEYTIIHTDILYPNL